ncbi:MAG: hypothetical protein J0H98_01800 [Solirubrobacterales bacterium]|nr:hypothetical protein [Solirubrobacterales bacterium]
MGSAGNLRSFVSCLAVASVGFLGLASGAAAQKVDGIKGKEATAPINLQMTPADAFVRIRGWSLPAPLLPLSVMGGWGGRGTVTGGGAINVPVGQISQPSSFEFPRDINGEQETMKVSLYARSDWTGQINPLNGELVMSMPTTLRIQASHVRMVDLPWPAGWIYGNIDCTVPLDFGPMTTSHMEPPVAGLEIPPVTDGEAYDPSDGTATVINNSMAIGGFSCSRPDIGAGKVEDELNGAVAIPSAPGTTDAKFNLSFLDGGDVIRPRPAIRPAFDSAPAGPGLATLNPAGSYAKAGVLRYVWDFNADGKPDQSTAEREILHDFGGPGEHQVGMLIVDKDGDISGWRRATVKTNAKPAPNVKRGLVVKARGPKKARPGATVKLRVTVANRSAKRAAKVVVCAGFRQRSIAKPGCRRVGAIRPGKAKKTVLAVKLSRSARGAVTLGVSAKGKGVAPGSTRVRFN